MKVSSFQSMHNKYNAVHTQECCCILMDNRYLKSMPNYSYVYFKSIETYLLVFRRKDLCKARPKREVCSNFQMSFLHLSQMDPPPP